jgi:mitogen-activated protein kinase 15
MGDVEEVDKHVLRRYDIQQKLGKGAYAVVFKAVDKKTKAVVAIKKIFDAFTNRTDAQRTFREIMYLQALTGHENIIRLQNVLKAENDKDIYLVFDFRETDLHAVIRANILETVHKQFITYQCLKAIFYCHSGGLVHRDLKPNNLLLDESCLCKVADFGLARSLVAMQVGEESVLTDYVATRWYRAPEILLGSTRYGMAVDMWAVGCILAEMFIGKPLLPGNSTMHQLEVIFDVTGAPTEEDIESMRSDYAAQLVQKVNKSATPGRALARLMEGAPEGLIDMCTKMLLLNPDKRMTIQQALEHPYVKPFRKGEEPSLPGPLRIPIDDDHQFSIEDYRETLYQKVVANRKDSAARNLLYFGRR